MGIWESIVATNERKMPIQRENQAESIIASLGDNIIFFHDTLHIPYAFIPTGEFCKTEPIRSKRFPLFLSNRFYEATGKVA